MYTLTLSSLQRARLEYRPAVPQCLDNLPTLDFQSIGTSACEPAIEPYFAHLCKKPELTLSRAQGLSKPLKIGVVLSGGQAPGGHNVISGIFDALQAIHPDSRLIGFLNGPSGIVKNQHKEISKELLAQFRNQGGFDIIGSGRTKIETQEQFTAALATVHAHDLDGLIVIGGDDSNTNAALLAEYFLKNGCKTRVAGVPKTIDGDLQSDKIEISFGFDSACKIYAETIGNIARDAISAKKYYYFIKLMGRSASHITLECALKTHPNLSLIGEEILAKNYTLADVTAQIIGLIKARYEQGKQFGIVLIPEGIIEFMPDVKLLIQQLNKLLASTSEHAAKINALSAAEEKIAYVSGCLSDKIKVTFAMLSQEIQLQLLLDRDPHGNVQVSKIETERLFIYLASQEMKKLGIPFSGQPIFCGYEGRSCLPSNFDCNYCYSLGQLAALLIARGHTGYIVSLQNLASPVKDWQAAVTPLISMLHLEERDGKQKPVIEKALVNLDSAPFAAFTAKREEWQLHDQYCQVGPMQFFGPAELQNEPPLTLQLRFKP